MAPKSLISKRSLEEAAFQIARREGVEAVTARRLAEELGCSTQPVYTACGSMASVKAVVQERSLELVKQTLMSAPPGVAPFLHLGLSSLRLARDEPHLFALASDFMRAQVAEAPPAPVLDAMKADGRLATMSDEQLSRVHTLLWVFSQGLATLLRPGSGAASLAQAAELLQQAGEAIVEFELKRVRAASAP